MPQRVGTFTREHLIPRTDISQLKRFSLPYLYSIVSDTDISKEPNKLNVSDPTLQRLLYHVHVTVRYGVEAGSDCPRRITAAQGTPNSHWPNVG